MPHYRQVGRVPRKRHTRAFEDGTADRGERLAEELLGTEGFSRESALLYHRRSPSAIREAEPMDDPRPRALPSNLAGPRHLRTPKLATGGDVVTGRHRLLANAEVTIGFVSATEDSPLHRCSAGDELVYVHRGTGVLESVFGALDVGAGDYVVVPAGATHRWVVTDGPLAALIVESSGHARIPGKYLSPHGQLLEGAPYSERDWRAPTEPHLAEGTDVPVLTRTRTGWVRYVHATHPFDVVAWDGFVYPHALSVHDFEPIVGRIHQPPPVHQTFELPGAVVCSFVPRPFDFDAEAVRVPYHHHNVDSDEVLFYAEGDFMSRAGSGIDVGSVSFHPAGFVHGPQPGSSARADKAFGEGRGTQEVAVMVDTFRPLTPLAPAADIDDPAYATSWT